MPEEIMDIVDEDNNVIGRAARKEIKKKNLLHRGISVLAFNDKGDMLIQKRTEDKSLYPGMYDLSVGGGVKAGETYENAAKREIEEELGVKTDVILAGTMRFKDEEDNCIVNIYATKIPDNINFCKEDMSEVKFLSEKELRKFIKRKDFIKNARLEIERYYEIAKKMVKKDDN